MNVKFDKEFLTKQSFIIEDIHLRMNKGFYVMVDRPGIKFVGDRQVRHMNKPRRLHLTLESASAEASRLAKKLKSRVLILGVVSAVEPENRTVS